MVDERFSDLGESSWYSLLSAGVSELNVTSGIISKLILISHACHLEHRNTAHCLMAGRTQRQKVTVRNRLGGGVISRAVLASEPWFGPPPPYLGVRTWR